MSGNFKKMITERLKDADRNRKYKKNRFAREFMKEHPCPPLTKEEKAEIDRYWATYHVKYKDYDWFRMFYGVTGIHDPHFLPQPFFERVLYQYYRKKRKFFPAYADKNMFPVFLPELRFPDTIGKRMHYRYYDADNQYLGDEVSDLVVDRFWDAFQKCGGGKESAIILKSSVNSGFGRSVKKLPVGSKADLKKILDETDWEDLVLQKVLHQHPFFAQLNADSVNIIRITTWRKGNDVYLFSPTIRFGIKGFHTDVAFVDGKEILNVLGIDPTGRVADTYVTLEGEHFDLPAEYDRQVPQWDKIVETVTAGARGLVYFDIVAWDVTVDDQNRVVCVEYNINMPGSLIYQFAHGPLAGEHTDDLLAFLKDGKYLHLIPPCIRKR